mgnify:CR=1 FL=1
MSAPSPKRNRSLPTHHKINLAGKVVRNPDFEKDGQEMKITLLAPQLYRHFIKTYCKLGDDISMEVVNKRPKRTESQNSFYHVYLDLISLSSGHTMQELKQWVKDTILSKGITEVFGTKIRVTDSSAELNISEFAEMMERIKELTGIPIPDPAPFNLPLTFDEYGKLKVLQKEKYQSMKSKKLKI